MDRDFLLNGAWAGGEDLDEVMVLGEGGGRRGHGGLMSARRWSGWTYLDLLDKGVEVGHQRGVRGPVARRAIAGLHVVLLMLWAMGGETTVSGLYGGATM